MGDIIEQRPGFACEIQYVYDNAVVYQEASITADGNVEPRGEVYIHKVGDSYVWCDTHQCIITSGQEHFGLTLSDEWEAV